MAAGMVFDVLPSKTEKGFFGVKRECEPPEK